MKNSEILKVCSFYADEYHLTTMILPYINKTVNDDENVLTILEFGIKSNIKELLSKINLKPEAQNKILQINWESNKTCKYSQIKNQIKTLAGDIQKVQIITAGTQDYMDRASRNVNKLLKEININKVTIIDCYDAREYTQIEDILNNHKYVLNTSGIKKIEEVFQIPKKEAKLG